MTSLCEKIFLLIYIYIYTSRHQSTVVQKILIKNNRNYIITYYTIVNNILLYIIPITYIRMSYFIDGHMLEKIIDKMIFFYYYCDILIIHVHYYIINNLNIK